MSENEKSWTTLDSYQAAWLSLEGFTPQLKSEHTGKIVFCFDNTPELHKSLASYHSGASVGALRFALSVKELKGRIFATKENDNYGNRRGF